jgi:hypothetical protein
MLTRFAARFIKNGPSILATYLVLRRLDARLFNFFFFFVLLLTLLLVFPRLFFRRREPPEMLQLAAAIGHNPRHIFVPHAALPAQTAHNDVLKSSASKRWFSSLRTLSISANVTAVSPRILWA